MAPGGKHQHKGGGGVGCDQGRAGAKANAAGGGAAALKGCPVPLEQGCSVGRPVDDKSDLDTVRVVCTNAGCTVGNYLHAECAEAWEQLLCKLLAREGRGRSWTETQRRANLWDKKGYTIVGKSFLCRCPCSQGRLRKDVDFHALQRAQLHQADADKNKGSSNGEVTQGGDGADLKQGDVVDVTADACDSSVAEHTVDESVANLDLSEFDVQRRRGSARAQRRQQRAQIAVTSGGQPRQIQNRANFRSSHKGDAQCRQRSGTAPRADNRQPDAAFVARRDDAGEWLLSLGVEAPGDALQPPLGIHPGGASAQSTADTYRKLSNPSPKQDIRSAVGRVQSVCDGYGFIETHSLPTPVLFASDHVRWAALEGIVQRDDTPLCDVFTAGDVVAFQCTMQVLKSACSWLAVHDSVYKLASITGLPKAAQASETSAVPLQPVELPPPPRQNCLPETEVHAAISVQTAAAPLAEECDAQRAFSLPVRQPQSMVSGARRPYELFGTCSLFLGEWVVSDRWPYRPPRRHHVHQRQLQRQLQQHQQLLMLQRGLL